MPLLDLYLKFALHLSLKLISISIAGFQLFPAFPSASLEDAGAEWQAAGKRLLPQRSLGQESSTASLGKLLCDLRCCYHRRLEALLLWIVDQHLCNICRQGSYLNACLGLTPGQLLVEVAV